MNRRQLLIGLSTGAVVGLAGCSDNGGDTNGTTDENGEENGEETPENGDNDLTEVDVSEYPPGLSETGIDTDEFLENSTLFSELFSVSYEARELFGDIESEDQYRDITAQTDIETATVHRIEDAFDGVRQEQYKVGSTTYNLIVDGDDIVQNRVIPQVPEEYAFQPIFDTGYARVTELIELMDINDSTVYENPDGDYIYEYRSDSTPEGNFENVEFSVWIHEDGLYQELSLTLETETDGYMFEIEFSDYGETEIEEPDWTEDSEEGEVDDIPEDELPDDGPIG